MADYTPEELARWYEENPWDVGMPEHLLVGSFGFQMAVLRYRLDDVKNEITAALPPRWRMAWWEFWGGHR